MREPFASTVGRGAFKLLEAPRAHHFTQPVVRGTEEAAGELGRPAPRVARAEPLLSLLYSEQLLAEMLKGNTVLPR